MADNIKKMIANINRSCDELDFIEARRLIEINLKPLSDPPSIRLLNSNARFLLTHIRSEKGNPSFEALTRVERHTINNINQYCTNFDISMLKRTLKDSMDLIQKPEALKLLNSDAKIILENMGAILGVETSVSKK